MSRAKYRRGSDGASAQNGRLEEKGYMMVRVRNNIGAASVLALALCLVAGCLFGVSKAYAEGPYSFNPSDSWTVSPPAGGYSNSAFMSFIDGDGFYALDDISITDVKSSNKKVAKAVVSDYGGNIEIKYGQKTGSTTISCKVNGQFLQHKFTVKYTCPVKKFKVGKVSALKTFKKKNTFVTKKTLGKKKMKVKAKKGWVITKAVTEVMGKLKEKTIKNKTKLSMKVKIKYPGDRVAVTFKNKKSGEEQVLTFTKYWDSRYAAAG